METWPLTLDPGKSTRDSGPVEGTPTGHRRATIHLLPRTRLGFWAVRLLVAFAAGLVVGMSLAAAGQISRGEGAFDSLWLTVPLMGAGLTAVVAGVLAAATAVVAIVRRGERSVLVFLPLIVGVLIAIFLLGELIGPE